ncbi:green-sensitive opsin, partial [Biomphalaria glabrata]
MTESQFYGVSDATLSPLPGNHSYRLEEDTTQEYLGMDVTSNTSNVTVSRYGIYGELEQYGVFWAAFYLHKYYLWVIFAFGFPGNIVSFITILRMKPLSSPIIYVAAVAFVDNSCLLCKILFYSFTRYDVHLTDGGCRTLFFLGSFTAQLANWLLVIMTVERCLAICLPLKVGSICT